MKMLPDAAGDVELLTGIAAGRSLTLVPYIFETHLQFLELSFAPGDTSATVRTKIPLDADVLADVSQDRPSVPPPGLGFATTQMNKCIYRGGQNIDQQHISYSSSTETGAPVVFL